MERREFLRRTGLAAASLWAGLPAGAAVTAEDVLGKIAPEDVGIRDVGEDFDFVIFADPQGGDPNDQTNDSPERVAIHNPYIEKNVEAVNRLRPEPAFLLIAGDIVDSKGQKSNYDVMLRFLKRLKTPVLFELGNHETRYGAKITPADMSELENFFDAQKQINGLDKLLYSFDLGKWHFVVWPDPLRRGFWEAHGHFFDWLDDDLRRHRNRPTILVQHISPLPIGIDPMIVYAEKVPVKRRLLDIVTRYGNVRYVLSGHTHIPLKASLKIARTYKGTKFINLPPAGYRARGFGEPDFGAGPSQGFALIRIRGEEATVAFHTVTGEARTYPAEFPQFKAEEFPLWLAERWRLPTHPQIVNGRFEKGLEGWTRRFLYEEDENPSSVCRTSETITHDGSNSLHLFCRPRGYHVRGQDRMPQSINRVCQALALEPGSDPLLRLAYRIDGRHFHPNEEAGAYVWLQGYSGSDEKLGMIYWIGMGFPNPIGLYAGRPPYAHWDITAAPDRWHEAAIHIAGDYNRRTKGPRFDRLNLDRLVVTLGVWTANVGDDRAIGVYFADLNIDLANASDAPSTVDGRPIKAKDKRQMWSKRMTHIDGEHVFVERNNK